MGLFFNIHRQHYDLCSKIFVYFSHRALACHTPVLWYKKYKGFHQWGVGGWKNNEEI